MQHGHSQAAMYPLGRCLDETRLVNQRVNRYHALQASLQHMAFASANGDKKAANSLKEKLGDLTEE